MAWYEGDFGRAVERHREALSLARATGDRAAEAAALNNLGVQAMEQGDNERAATHISASLAVARASGEPRAGILALHNLAQVARLDHQGAVAEARVAEALAVARAYGDATIVTSALTALGHVLIDLGEASRAAPAFQESLESSDRRENAGQVIDALEGIARLEAEQGDAERAARLFGAASALRDAVGVPASPSDTAYFAPAMEALRSALGSERLAAIMAEGRKLSRRAAVAQALATTPPPATSKAITLLPSAPAQGPERPGFGELSDLTPREMEVLRLVADGLSDKEIGARLAISPQTVAKHVGSLLRKLGAPSRTAAATLAMRRGYL
jgi:non-specific serine/threonine protein kinase